jgi:nucleoside-diphosphate-sugar epimerase
MILVTGASGLVGSHILYDLIGKNERIRATYRSEKRKNRVKAVFEYYNTSMNQSHDYSLIEWVPADILNLDEMEEAMEGISKVIHCAALVSFHKIDFNRCMTVNRTGTANIVNLCLRLKIEKLCYISSTAAIGTDADPITESTSWKPGKEVSGYSVSKYSAEKEVFRGIAEGLNASIVNPCLIIGPGHWNRSSLTVLKGASRGMRFYPTGSNAIVDARDVSKIVLKLLYSQESGEKYLLTGHNISFLELLTQVSTACNTRVPSKKLNKGLAKFLTVIIESMYRVFRKRSPVSIESIYSAYHTHKYSNQKVTERFDYQFHTLQDTFDNAIKGRIKD